MANQLKIENIVSEKKISISTVDGKTQVFDTAEYDLRNITMHMTSEPAIELVKVAVREEKVKNGKGDIDKTHYRPLKTGDTSKVVVIPVRNITNFTETQIYNGIDE